MDKKDIYEHLATIYLDASLKKKKKKTKILPPLFNLPFFIFLFFIFGFTIILSAFINRNKSLDFQPSFVLQPAALKINFRFDPGPKETYSIALNKLDLNGFRTLGFSVKKVDYKKEPVALRVRFTNQFKENSEIYVKNIPARWQDYRINLSDFKDISEWSRMREVSFVVEGPGAKEKRGVLYIANVKLLK